MKLTKRQLWLFGMITVGAIILITLIAAPANNKLNSGSTYGRAPNGYGAWYAFMSERETPVQRWQKPFEQLIDSQNAISPMTLLRVYSNLTFPGLDKQSKLQLLEKEQNWIGRGNTLVLLGVWQPMTEALFSTMHSAEVGKIKIETGRRNKNVKQPILGDRFGAIVWQEKIGKGQVIFATTPHLAANAYQDYQSNYEFLAQLVTQEKEGKTSKGGQANSVWVDEYIHGYKDAEVIRREKGRNVFSYLGQTPLFSAFVQGLILLLVGIWMANRRFGQPLTLSSPIVDNSEAYIQALAEVLQKANSTEFVVEVVGKQEQLQLQKALMLGEVPVDPQTLVDAWVQQTGRSATELKQLLQIQSRKRRMNETELLTWLGQWEQIRQYLPSYSDL